MMCMPVVEDFLIEDIFYAINKHVLRFKRNYVHVVKTVIHALQNTIDGNGEDPTKAPKLSIIKRPPECDDDNESIVQLEQLGASKALQTNPNTIDELASLIRRSKSDFNNMILGFKRATEQWTDIPDNVSLLRTHLLTASLVWRVPHQKSEIKNVPDMAGRVLDAIRMLPSQTPSKKELACLVELNKSSPYQFEYNWKTCFDAFNCGTPDAVAYEKSRLVAVAEFKAEGEKFEGKYQMLTYLKILGLSNGYLVLYDNELHCSLDKITITVKDKATLVKKNETFKRFRSMLK